MNILLDLDGVVVMYDFPTLIYKHFGQRVAQEEIVTYSIEECLGVPPALVNKMFKEECRSAPVFVPKARESVLALSEEHLIFIWSNRLRFMSQGELADWLLGNGIPFSEIVTNPNTFTRGFFDIHVDDCITKLLSTNDAVDRRLLFSQPWNLECKNILGIFTRVYDWKSIMEIVNAGA